MNLFRLCPVPDYSPHTARSLLPNHKPSAYAYVDLHAMMTSTTALPIIDEAAALEQCGDWAFVAELLLDILAEGQAAMSVLQAACISRDATKYRRAAHAIKSSAMSVHLPALSQVSQHAEEMGQQMERETDARRQLYLLLAPLSSLRTELDRLREYIPVAQARVQLEQEAGETSMIVDDSTADGSS